MAAGSEDGKPPPAKVPPLVMFRFADCTDAALMAVGTVAAMANGMAEPLMTLVFAAIIECFGDGDDATVLHRVSKVPPGQPYPLRLSLTNEPTSRSAVDAHGGTAENLVSSSTVRLGDEGQLWASCSTTMPVWSLEERRPVALQPAGGGAAELDEPAGCSPVEPCARAIGNASPSISAIAEGQAAAQRLFKIINRKPNIDITDTSGIVLEDIKGDVELKDVFFRYPARPEQVILDGFCLQVPSGTTVAIVGQSGSGKSTVISLVERFYDPQAGEVLVDGVNIKNLQLQWLRGKISLVSQEPLLFMTSIKDNITYGKADATFEEIKRAAELANVANFIEKLPNAYETMVGQRGAQLSGGQKQRIAIARAILKNPKVLLLDEATSALDVESERVVQEALNRIMVGRTTLIVAHRLSTIRNADCIAVVHQGKVVERGVHDELIKDPDGAYSQLIRLQQAHTKEMHEVPNTEVSAYGKQGEVSEDEIISAAKAANAHEFISSLPQGYSTTVGERGTQLSGGQKQRIAIARAILKDPRILLLDEATSALDAEAERIVQEALDQVMVSRTTIVVAHRLSTIKGADIIAVIKDGKVAEKGKHESLVGIKGGVYASLVELHSKSA
nr:unnamed protein product [Digitaria exilis]